MRFLLDTHTFLWWVSDDPQLSKNALRLIASPDNDIFLSSVSGWEIAINVQLGKMKVPAPFEQFVAEQIFHNDIATLPIKMSHALHVQSLPLHHRDPFDRMLIVQSQLEKMPIISVDSVFEYYDVEVVW